MSQAFTHKHEQRLVFQPALFNMNFSIQLQTQYLKIEHLLAEWYAFINIATVYGLQRG